MRDTLQFIEEPFILTRNLRRRNFFKLNFSLFFFCQTNLKVYVREADERDPRFDQLHYRFAVPENKAGILVGRVELKPRKFRVNSQMVYSIVNTEMRSLFNITPVSFDSLPTHLPVEIVINQLMDEENKLTCYQIQSNMSFSCRQQEGEIYTKQGLDRERRSQFVFTVMLEEKRTTSKIVRFHSLFEYFSRVLDDVAI